MGRTTTLRGGLGGKSATAAEQAWVEVIEKMDETYAELVRYEVELEDKNATLEETQGFLASVLASMSDVLVVCDHNGLVQQVNESLEAIVGVKASELAGRPLPSLFVADQRDMVSGLLTRVRRAPLHDYELRLDNGAQGTPVSMNCTARRDHRGRFAGVVLIGRPLGELRRAYEALHQAHEELKGAQRRLLEAEKMASLGRLVAGVAHEINNPVSFVYSNVHALHRYIERLTEYLDCVHGHGLGAAQEALRARLRIDHVAADIDPLMAGAMEGCERVRDIVQGLREFSASTPRETRPFDLVPVLRRAAAWVARVVPRTLVVECDLPETLMWRGHPGRWQQVFTNILQNANDAMADLAAPRVFVHAGRDTDRAWVEVRDVGPGIPEDAMERIFEPFFTGKRVGEGLGLGLAISYGIVSEAGGLLSAYNHDGGGAVFRVELPMTEAGA